MNAFGAQERSDIINRYQSFSTIMPAFAADLSPCSASETWMSGFAGYDSE
jgi:hypothetical protein